ncbi:MAG: urea transporter [Alistipes sp.]|nr:urea transporter [Alistipes sp.]
MKKEERENKLTRSEGEYPAGLLKVLLRGAGQVMFQNNAWTGLLFLAGIFWGAYHSGHGVVAWGALLGLAVSTLTGYILGLTRRDGEQGLWGFNGILVGCALPAFLGNTAWMWLCVIIFSMLTTFVRTGFNNIMSRWKINSLTFPFVFCTWIALAAARAMHAIPPVHLSDPMLPSFFASGESLRFVDLLVYWLKGIAQVFVIDSWVSGLLFLVGLFISSRWAALWAAVGSAVALLVAILFRAAGSDVTAGIYGYSAVLTAIAVATVFYRPGVRSALWALFAIVVTVFVQAAVSVAVGPLGLAPLTAPFCIATWLFLLPLIRFDDDHPDHSNWYPENKRHLSKGR